MNEPAGPGEEKKGSKRENERRACTINNESDTPW